MFTVNDGGDKIYAAENLIECIKNTTSAPLAVEHFSNILGKNGFRYIDLMGNIEELTPGRYYGSLYGNMLVAFTVSPGVTQDSKLKIVSAHIDSPALAVKPSPDVHAAGCHKLNVEVYGGPILTSWFDRPLSVSGRVMIYNRDNEFSPREVLVDFKRPILTIPSLAIHMNREVNKGIEINRQSDMQPVITTLGMGDDRSFAAILATEIGCGEEDILDYDLFVYNCDGGHIVGTSGDLILAPRLDNITSSYAAVQALCESSAPDGVNMVILYDNEEVGSRTKQGAGSHSVNFVINKICRAFGIKDKDSFIMNGNMISVDVAHAKHPNHADKSDPTNEVLLNKGIVIKKACSQSYSTDSRMSALVKVICMKYNIPYQVFVNKSDMSGGSTLGSIASSFLPMQTIDIGIPLLGMHSSCETCGVYDQMYMQEFLKEFYDMP